MPKFKTHKSISKRFKIKKKSGKIIKRTAGQDHFNSRESGKITRKKRKDKCVARTEYKIIKNNL